MSGVGGWEPPPPPPPGWPPPPPASPPPPEGGPPGPSAPPAWDAPQPWAQPWATPPPPPPRRGPSNGLVIGLGVAAALVFLVLALVAVTGRASRVSREPVANIDHWHAAYGVYLCDRYLDPVQGDGDRNGIHSHGDGVVHVEPLNSASAGPNAIFRRFEEAQRSQITERSLRWVDGTVPVQAVVSDGCDGRPAEISSYVDGLRVGSAPGDIRLKDGQVIVVVFAAEGTSYEQIGPPPSAGDLPRIRGLIP
jgi:hypothetical protein